VPDLLRLIVLTPGKTLLEVANVSKVRLKLADGGWLSIYPRHAPLLAETMAGPLIYTTDAGEQTISLSESILQVAENDVVLFAGGELTASAAPVGEGEGEDAADAHFDRLARVLMLSLQALPAETAGDFETVGARS
jgi:F0F1-type ATP synthase epsilon subunit